MLQSMFLLVPDSFQRGTPHFDKLLLDGWKLIALTGAIALLAPNTYQIFRRYRPALPTYPYVRAATPVTPASAGMLGRILQPTWRPSWRWSLLIGLTFGAAIVGIAGWRAEFLYFQF
jgi:hypothetical protein